MQTSPPCCSCFSRGPRSPRSLRRVRPEQNDEVRPFEHVVPEPVEEDKGSEDDVLEDDEPRKCVCCKRCCFVCAVSIIAIILSLALYVSIRTAIAEPLTDEASIFLDGWTQIPVPRKLVTGHTSAFFQEITMADAGIRVEGEHVFVPFGRMMQGEFVQISQLTGVEESGVSKFIVMKNPTSVFGDDLPLGTMEKLHVTSHKGPWNQRALDRVNSDKSDRLDFTKWLAKTLRSIRGILLHMHVFGGIGYVNAFLDDEVRASQKQYIANASGIPSERLENGLAAMAESLNASRAQGVHPNYEVSINSCSHFEEDPSINVTDAGVFMPLNRMLVAHRGHTTFAPRSEMSLKTGVVMFNVDSATRKLQQYYITSAEMLADDPLDDLAEPPVVHVGPSDFGNTLYEGEDKRAANHHRSWLVWFVYSLYSSIPIDYGFLHSDPKHLCPESVYSEFDATLTDADMTAFVRDPPGLGKALELAQLFSDTVVCGTEFIGAGSDEESQSFEIDDAHGYDLFEALTWTHAFLESPQELRMYALANREWNIH